MNKMINGTEKRGAEEWEQPSYTGYSDPHGDFTIGRELGSMKKLRTKSNGTEVPALRYRTKGKTVIPARKPVFEWVNEKFICTEQGRPPMVAYIDELKAIQRPCVVCGKWLSDTTVKYDYWFVHGIKQNPFRQRKLSGMKADSDELHNAPICDIGLSPIRSEESFCAECEKDL